VINKLLCKDKTKRLGGNGDVEEILSHPFFADLDIKKLLKKEIPPPYKPEISDDLKFFNKNLTSLQNIEESVIDKDR
jgi:hypothetical protein